MWRDVIKILFLAAVIGILPILIGTAQLTCKTMTLSISDAFGAPCMSQAKAASMRFELEVARERKYESQPGVPAKVSSK
jgi:hypothetical protein